MSAWRNISSSASAGATCTAPYVSGWAVQARCRGELFIECSRLDDKVPISHEDQMSTLRKVGLALPLRLHQNQSHACGVPASADVCSTHDVNSNAVCPACLC